MKLRELFADQPVVGLDQAADTEVTGVSHDSRRVAPGDLFVAWQGERFDGAEFAPQAIAAGARAVLAATASARPAGTEAVPWLTADDPHRLLAPLADRLWNWPGRELRVAGVTGTNGKSTVVALLQSILTRAGWPCGIFGTLGYGFGEWVESAARTTPEGSDLFRLLRRMADSGAAAVAMEMSSHALALGRLGELALDLAVFTNLTRDHLDLHGDLESYFQAKAAIFDRLRDGGVGVVNVDDSFGRRMVEERPGLRTYSAQGAAADVAVVDAHLDLTGTRATLRTPRGDLAFRSPLLGRFNLANLVAAAAGAEALGVAHEVIADGLAEVAPITGRMERVSAPDDLPVFVDYAHTEEALRAALSSLAEITGRSLIVVFGCGGDRDRGKRHTMGRIAGELAELPIVTSDNPRGEDPHDILAEVEKGLAESGNRSYRVVPDRREAIRRAIAVARDDQAVLIAGKGHEQVQTIGDREIRFSDHEEARRALEGRCGEAVRG